MRSNLLDKVPVDAFSVLEHSLESLHFEGKFYLIQFFTETKINSDFLILISTQPDLVKL